MHSMWDVAKEKDLLYPLNEGLSNLVEDGFPVGIGQTGAGQGVGARFGGKVNRGAIQEEMQVGGPVGRGGTWEKVQTEAMNKRGCHQPQVVFQLWGEMMSPGEMKQVDKRMECSGMPRGRV